MADDDKDLDDLETSDTEGVSEDSEETPTAPELETDTESETVTPPVAPPPLTEEYHEHDGRRLLSIIGLFVAAFIVAALIVLAARAIYRHYHHPKPGKPPVVEPPVPSPQPHTKPHNKPSNKHGANGLPNNGPGDTVGMFVGITLAAAGLHFIISLRRARQS